MNVSIHYELILKNNNKLQGNITAKIGEPIEDVKFRILQKEGFKNYGSFACVSEDQQKITVRTTNIGFVEKEISKKSSKISEGSPSKVSNQSIFEQSSIDLDKQAREFIVREPQKPPLVRGRVERCNKFFCCLTSTLYLELRIDLLKFYDNNKYDVVSKTIHIHEIKKIRSFRKKAIFFISLHLEEETIQFSFRNMNLCKQWMGYLMQAMEFSRYLLEKKLFSRADSFRQYMKTIIPTEQEKLVLLEQGNQHLQTIYQNLPHEREVERKLKKLVKFSEFDIQYKIGSGSFSLVYLARRNGSVYALKQLSKDKLLAKNQMKYALIQLKALQTCRGCKYVIPIYFAFQTLDYLYLALKYVSSGDLDNQIKAKGRFSNGEALIILAELVYTIQYLHHHKIIYRDLKPENIMLDEVGHIYLVDFGLAKELSAQDDYADSFLGTFLYLAPQRFRGSGSINFKSDIYGVGCIFYEMLHGQTPFRGSTYQTLSNKIKNDEPELRRDLPPDFLSFLHSTLQKDPERRLLRMSEHIIFKDINWKDIAAKKHSGIKIESSSPLSSVQINYKIDEDYNEETYPQRLIAEWQFNIQKEE